MDASLKWQFDTPLWHIDAVGGVHPITVIAWRAQALAQPRAVPPPGLERPINGYDARARLTRRVCGRS
jgi:hypothetical protein